MRLHHLTVQALQAFAGREEVDFDALSEAGLFLLHGDTGAGKTTLLDSVCFAFYGSLPGTRGSDARIRSDHAAADLPTEVVLEATLRGERVRITRRPKQLRPRQKGQGAPVEANATVLVQRQEDDGTWTTLATRAEEAAHELGRLLGMSRDQFCQVVLLPQGEFASFLRATSDERWKLLERLFATERFTAAERWLARRRQDASAELQEADRLVADTASRLAQTVGAEPPDGWQSEPDTLTPWAEEARVLADAEALTAERAAAEETAARQAAQAALTAAQALAARQAEHASAVADLAAWQAKAGKRDAGARELAAARAAAPVGAGIARLREVESRVEALDAAVRTRLGELGRPMDQDAAALREEARICHHDAGQVRALAPLESGVIDARTAIAELGRHADEAERVAAAARSFAEGSAARRAALAEELDVARRCAEALASRERDASAARERAAAAARRDALRTQHAVALDAVRDAIGAEQAAVSELLDLRRRRLDGIAAELAGKLQPGEPCAVCGSAEHPAPAAPDATEAVTAEAERAAAAFADERRGLREAAEAESGKLARELAAAAAVAGEASTAELQEAADHARGELARVRELALREPAAAAALTAFDVELESCRATAAEQGERAARLRAQLAERTARLAEDEGRLSSGLVGARSVADRAAVVEAEAGRLERAADALVELAAARRLQEEAREQVAGEAVLAGFDDVAAARAAVRDPARIEELEDRLRRFDEGLAAIRARVEDEALQAAASLAAPDVDGAVRRAAEAEAADRSAGEADALARNRASTLAGLERELDERLREREPIADAARRIRELSLIAEGSSVQNRKRMRFSAYVLAARLEAIAAAASVRLLGMSGGRYTLEHSDERASHNRGSGLDLRVVDSWTGGSRHPSTLSGGETFLASLALALGLADVVAAESGGARLETLFVDEGFGTLDEGTLDEVLEVLDALREGGRAVGIVSHVGELRQRVPTQLHVAKGRAGSHVVQAERVG